MGETDEIRKLRNEVKDLRTLVEELAAAAGLENVVEAHRARNREQRQRRAQQFSEASLGRKRRPPPGG
ncbi:MAG TPA: hypothetical protein VF731_00960 [Solirubrobacterales bacterium]